MVDITIPQATRALANTLDAGSAARVLALTANALAPGTRRHYACLSLGYQRWCSLNDRVAVPASVETLAEYFSYRSFRVSPRTLKADLTAIRYFHTYHGYPPPRYELVRLLLRGAEKAGKKSTPKRPLTTEHLDIISQWLEEDENLDRRARNAAITFLGSAGGFRRSELVALNVADVKVCRKGLEVFIARSKTDQCGDGFTMCIPYERTNCPVKAVLKLLHRLPHDVGPLFTRLDRRGRLTRKRLGAQAVCHLVKAYAQRLGEEAGAYGAHSLRSACATQMHEAGHTDVAMLYRMRQSSAASLLPYLRYSRQWLTNSTTSLGL